MAWEAYWGGFRHPKSRYPVVRAGVGRGVNLDGQRCAHRVAL